MRPSPPRVRWEPPRTPRDRHRSSRSGCRPTTHPSGQSGDHTFGHCQRLLHDPGATSREYRGRGVAAHLRPPPHRRNVHATSGRPTGSIVCARVTGEPVSRWSYQPGPLPAWTECRSHPIAGSRLRSRQTAARGDVPCSFPKWSERIWSWWLSALLSQQQDFGGGSTDSRASDRRRQRWWSNPERDLRIIVRAYRSVMWSGSVIHLALPDRLMARNGDRCSPRTTHDSWKSVSSHRNQIG